MSKKKLSTQPPIIFTHNESGALIIGEDKKNTRRVRDVGLHASQSDCQLRLFEDGGFNLTSSARKGGKDGGDANERLGSYIRQKCDKSPLIIESKGDLTLKSDYTIRLLAKNIIIESSDADGTGINLDAESDIVINSRRDYICTADNITHDAKEKVLTHSEGWNIIACQHFRISESISQLTPLIHKTYIESLTKNLKG